MYILFCIDHTISTPTEPRNELKNDKHIVWLDMEVPNCHELSNSATEGRRELKETEFFR